MCNYVRMPVNLIYWSLVMRIVGNNIPPSVEVKDIKTAFSIIQSFIAECGNTINVDLPDRYNTDHISGVEIEDETMRLIWYSVDKAYRGLEDTEENNPIIELNQYVVGENLEQQYGFTFDRMLLTSSYILIYAKLREVPVEIEADEEILKKQIHPKLTIYEHHWGSFNQKPILQIRTRYYCNEGLVAVIYPKAIWNAIRPDDYFKS